MKGDATSGNREAAHFFYFGSTAPLAYIQGKQPVMKKCIFDECDAVATRNISLTFSQRKTGHLYQGEVRLCDAHFDFIEASSHRHLFHLKWEVTSHLPASKRYSLPVKITHIGHKD